MLPGSPEPRILPTNALRALGFAPKLFLAQVRPALVKDLTQMSPESPKPGLVIPASLLLGHLAPVGTVLGRACCLSHPRLPPPAYTEHSTQHRVPAWHQLAECVPM